MRRRGFLFGLLASAVVAVSTSLPMLNREQATPARPPTVERIRCSKCGFEPASLSIQPWNPDLSKAASLATKVIVQMEEARIESGFCLYCELTRPSPHFVQLFNMANDLETRVIWPVEGART